MTYLLLPRGLLNCGKISKTVWFEDQWITAVYFILGWCHTFEFGAHDTKDVWASASWNGLVHSLTHVRSNGFWVRRFVYILVYVYLTTLCIYTLLRKCHRSKNEILCSYSKTYLHRALSICLYFVKVKNIVV